jgi:hypothetical protein
MRWIPRSSASGDASSTKLDLPHWLRLSARSPMTVEPAYTFQKPEGLLAHYTDAAAVFEHILPERRLRMSPYHRMRDPVESQDILPAISWSGDQPGAERATWAVLDDIKTARDAMRVLACSCDAGDGVGLRRAAFDCSWARPRMWEQYGDNHAGACLLFDRGRLEATLRNELGDERLYVGNVRYDRQGIAASQVQHVTDERIFDETQRQKAVADHIDRYRDDFFFLKGDDFETEAEYRVVLKTDDESPVGYTTDEEGCAYVGYGDALVAVVLGLHFPEWQRAGARELCDGTRVKMLRMWWERGTPVLLGTGES